jgi:hypothetical protein
LAFDEADPPLRSRLFRHGSQPLARGEHVGGSLGADFAKRDEGAVEHDRIAQRADREAVLVMPDAEASFGGVESEPELAPVERIAVALGEERHHELAVGAKALPIDVEGPRSRRELAPFQH